jgi:hypothetical protein
MAENVTTPLILDLLAWLAKEPRPYGEVMEVWRTSCPRLTVWEDAVDLGYVGRRREAEGEPLVALTLLGEQRLAERSAAPLLAGARPGGPTASSPKPDPRRLR